MRASLEAGQCGRYRSAPLVAASLLTAALVGCGGRPATVSGVVTLDGAPLPHGTVAFNPKAQGMMATAIIQSDGSYEVKTNRDAGLDLGDYEVTVSCREVVITDPDLPPMPGKYIAPQKYERAETSGFVFAVESGHNEINLELTSE